MSILIYSGTNERIGESLQGIVKDLVSKDELEIFQTIPALYERLHKLRYDIVAIVLVVERKLVLLKLISFRELFSDLRIVLLLPDRESDTISKGNLLFPRFMTFVDSDLHAVKAVLGRIIENDHGSYRAGR